MELSAARAGGILNHASLARDASLNAQTTGRYFSLLEASCLVRRLHLWYSNIGKRLVKSPKLYWTDTGLACSLAGLHDVDLSTHPMRGALFETMVAGEVLYAGTEIKRLSRPVVALPFS